MEPLKLCCSYAHTICTVAGLGAVFFQTSLTLVWHASACFDLCLTVIVGTSVICSSSGPLFRVCCVHAGDRLFLEAGLLRSGRANKGTNNPGHNKTTNNNSNSGSCSNSNTGSNTVGSGSNNNSGNSQNVTAAAAQRLFAEHCQHNHTMLVTLSVQALNHMQAFAHCRCVNSAECQLSTSSLRAVLLLCSVLQEGMQHLPLWVLCCWCW